MAKKKDLRTVKEERTVATDLDASNKMVKKHRKGTNPPASKRRNRPLKVAIACPGIGLVQRGFERYYSDLFQVLKDDIDVTIFKGGGARSEKEKVLFFASRNGPLNKYFPLYKLFGRTKMHAEDLTFALALLPYLYRGQFDVVQCIDPPLVKFLFWVRHAFGLKFRVLYTHGVTMIPEEYPPADHIQHVGQAVYEETLEFGIPEAYSSMVPVGFFPERFECSSSREELRRAYGVGQDTFVILCVAAPNRYHKRTDYLIEEVSRLEGDFLLWLDGSMDYADPDLIDVAKERLGDKCRYTHVASDKVGELYRLADVMAHCSLWEAFGMSIVEGASCGLALLIHNTPHFQWLIPNPPSWMDMEKSGVLTERLASLMAHPEELESLRLSQELRGRFSWNSIKHEYIDVYHRVADISYETIEEAGRDGLIRSHE